MYVHTLVCYEGKCLLFVDGGSVRIMSFTIPNQQARKCCRGITNRAERKEQVASCLLLEVRGNSYRFWSGAKQRCGAL